LYSHLIVKLTVKAGTSLALTCSASGVPLPEVRWLKGGKVLSRGLGEAAVLLEYLTREDQGEIECEATNTMGDSHSDYLSLDILNAPEVDISEPRISFKPQCGMEFHCLVHSSSSPTVQWFQNDLLLQTKDDLTMWNLDNIHVLRINSCDQKILGQFTCKAESSMGEAEKTFAVYKEFVESKIEEHLLKEEYSNNVRRNVNHQQTLPLVSSVSRTLISSSLLVILVYHFL
jgi:hypothetical protein